MLSIIVLSKRKRNENTISGHCYPDPIGRLRPRSTQSTRTSKMTFKVEISKLVESHQESWMVVLTNLDIRPKDASPFDSIGQAVPFRSTVDWEAELEASEWAEFLGCKVTKCASTD